MLQEFDVSAKIEQLMHHYDDLNRAHETVLKARSQIEKLTIIAASCDRQESINQRITAMRQNREQLRSFFALKKLEMLQIEEQSLQTQIAELGEKIESLKTIGGRLQGDRDDLKQQIATKGGDRIERLKALVSEKNLAKEMTRKKADAYGRFARLAGFEIPDNLDSFLANRRRIDELLPACRKRDEELQTRFTDQTIDLRKHQAEHKNLSEEIESLKRRRSNIPGLQISIRNALCSSLAIEETQLPFVGELIQVRESEKAWEGAIERLLHNFGLSLLVPDKLYAKVAEWVDKTDLHGRIVYFRVKEEAVGVASELHPDSLVKKLEIKADSEFYGWLERELGRRFDYACCENIERFRREHQAITRNGQSKSGGQRHEKDDRHSIADRSRYVLGWSNEAKIRALAADLKRVNTKIDAISSSLAALQKERINNQNTKSAYESMLVYEHFSDIDWQQIAREIADLDKERQQLEESSDTLKQLSIKLQETEGKIASNQDKLDAASNTRSKSEERQSINKQKIEDTSAIVEAVPQQERPELCARIGQLCEELKPGETLTLRNCESFEGALREHLQSRIDSDARRLKTVEEQIVQLMQDYRRDYPVETQEFDARVEAAGEYREILRKLVEDSLPAFEERFKKLLNENTINEIANFNTQLNLECQNIKERIGKINHSLAQIEYNPGRYIRLEDQQAPDADIRDFKQELRACTEGTLTGNEDEHYAEGKFMRVKAIIERFRGREGLADSDLRWRRKVTDVRNWFVFAASERWNEDNTEYEHYTDSGGKSGGQKEKLAYTVLAASLAYQFGLERGVVRSRSFRFVVIDEAFSRGSEESTRYGLELFRQMNLQLLVVTPLQKIHIIEPYVESVGFVYGNDSRESMLRNLTIAEYREEREARAR
ncbi:MAG: Chromosome segregation protein SMC-like [Candidatus Rifleibacterium amylolyticum]|nr:MAG: Chromosome segregation protein SMC-like [Candidatus Rifleibacterium amylolyticum]